ncbi:hypothetical protein VNO77_42376 [Canavalia gladiata]|uniref:Uncharacterized protein n=1 Tax=Canavalia gladiata TaxID=3824 RepID=A0AAN9PQY7_CANGL
MHGVLECICLIPSSKANLSIETKARLMDENLRPSPELPYVSIGARGSTPVAIATNGHVLRGKDTNKIPVQKRILNSVRKLSRIRASKTIRTEILFPCKISRIKADLARTIGTPILFLQEIQTPTDMHPICLLPGAMVYKRRRLCKHPELMRYVDMIESRGEPKRNVMREAL